VTTSVKAGLVVVSAWLNTARAGVTDADRTATIPSPVRETGEPTTVALLVIVAVPV
jgi:hypothetical protein